MALSSTHVSQSAGRIRLGFLDGLRGLTALYVVFYHVYHPLVNGVLKDNPLRLTLIWAAAGRYAVSVFIVLSGCVLMLPVTRSATSALAGGITGFMRRRARRILPPYFAALVLSLLLVWLFAAPLGTPGRYGNALLPAFEIPNLLAHALLLHNLNAKWIFTINSALWSVATEWQIYVLFALLLRPLSQRIPMWTLVPSGLLLGVALHTLLGITSAASFWFIGLFDTLGTAMACPVCGCAAVVCDWLRAE
jgi:peptidoglycan/LPS O-acetylase OafA/YrhL